MTSKDDQYALAYAEYFMILAAIKERCDAEDAAAATHSRQEKTRPAERILIS